MAARKQAAKKKAKEVKAPADIKRILSDLRGALMGWDGNMDSRNEADWADVTLTPGQVRRMWKAIDKYGA